MELLRNFFVLNREIIYFIYGLAFFLLGFAIALQSRRYSRLDLARSLIWLAAFGITHGLFEWGDLFIPIQAKYLNPLVVQTLNVIHLILLAVSFSLLFQFGLALLKSLGWASWTGYVALGLFIVWAIVTFLILPLGLADFAVWSNTSRALARYFISFPGSLLAAYGLREQALRRIAPLSAPHIVNTLRISGMALVLYAFVGGLVPPPAPFFPANIINTTTFFATFGIPALVFRTAIGFVLTISIIRALEVFELETDRLIEGMEQTQILAAERERIARNLHDGAIQKVYTAGLLLESASKLVTNEAVTIRLNKALEVLNDSIGDLRRNLGELRSTPADETLTASLHTVAADPRFRSLVNVTVDLDLPSTESLSPVRTAHVIAIVNESLSNIVRHARAQQVLITARRDNGTLQLTINDDGIGIADELKAGYGLRNMRDRARLLNGTIQIEKADHKGTRVTLLIPWKDEH